MQGVRCILTLKYSTVLLDWNLSVVLVSQTVSSLSNRSYPAAWLEGQNELLDTFCLKALTLIFSQITYEGYGLLACDNL